jgi:ABC-type transporter Mla maintaining outer membrane lipid asymmetry permease subunit MlaE
MNTYAMPGMGVLPGRVIVSPYIMPGLGVLNTPQSVAPAVIQVPAASVTVTVVQRDQPVFSTSTQLVVDAINAQADMLRGLLVESRIGVGLLNEGMNLHEDLEGLREDECLDLDEGM